MNMISLSESDCCSCEGPIKDPSYGCAEKKLVFTKREQDVLGKIREVSMRARSIKARIQDMPPGDGALGEARLELESLRDIRKELELERVAAAEERMRMLGHVPMV